MLQQQRHVEPAIANELRADPSSIDDSSVPEVLQDVVLRHQVSYEVWSEWSRCGGRARHIGYCVSSVSTCDVNDRVHCARGHHVPGCPHCGLTYDEIRKIAGWITLKEQPDCWFQIEPFNRALPIAPRQRWLRNEIIVNIRYCTVTTLMPRWVSRRSVVWRSWGRAK